MSFYQQQPDFQSYMHMLYQYDEIYYIQQHIAFNDNIFQTTRNTNIQHFSTCFKCILLIYMRYPDALYELANNNSEGKMNLFT